MDRMFDWFFSLFDGLFPNPRIERTWKPSKTCKVCGRVYYNVDAAAICGDWDKTLGLNRLPPRKSKPTLWQRFYRWLKNIFSPLIERSLQCQVCRRWYTSAEIAEMCAHGDMRGFTREVIARKVKEEEIRTKKF